MRGPSSGRRPDFLREPSRRFEFQLARDLHYRTVAELRRWMSLPEWVDWIAIYTIEAQERKQAQQKARQRRGRRR
jgi:hypothetical protein